MLVQRDLNRRRSLRFVRTDAPSNRPRTRVRSAKSKEIYILHFDNVTTEVAVHVRRDSCPVIVNKLEHDALYCNTNIRWSWHGSEVSCLSMLAWYLLLATR